MQEGALRVLCFLASWALLAASGGVLAPSWSLWGGLLRESRQPKLKFVVDPGWVGGMVRWLELCLLLVSFPLDGKGHCAARCEGRAADMGPCTKCAKTHGSHFYCLATPGLSTSQEVDNRLWCAAFRWWLAGVVKVVF